MYSPPAKKNSATTKGRDKAAASPTTIANHSFWNATTAMKRTILLSMAVCTGAASLRGDGVEEVGEQIEHFPPEDYDGVIDRRALKQNAAEPTEEIFDPWPDRDIVGMLVEDEDKIYVEEYVDGDDEEDYGEGETAEEYIGDSDNQIVILGQESVETGDDTPASKEYLRDAHNVMVSYGRAHGMLCSPGSSSRSLMSDAT